MLVRQTEFLHHNHSNVKGTKFSSDNDKMKTKTVRDIEKLLDKTESPNRLLRPQFWKMSFRDLCSGLNQQFIDGVSADQVCLQYEMYESCNDNCQEYASLFMFCFMFTLGSGLATRGQQSPWSFSRPKASLTFSTALEDMQQVTRTSMIDSKTNVP